MLSGIAVGSASIVIWWVTCSSTPPSLTPGASSVPEQLDRDLGLDRLVELDLEQVEVDQRRRAPGSRCCSLTTTGVAPSAVELEVDQRAAARRAPCAPAARAPETARASLPPP